MGSVKCVGLLSSFLQLRLMEQASAWVFASHHLKCVVSFVVIFKRNSERIFALNLDYISLSLKE